MPGKVEPEPVSSASVKTRRALLAEWSLAALMTACSQPPVPTAAPIPTGMTLYARDKDKPSLTRLQADLHFPQTIRNLDHGRVIINTPDGLVPNESATLGQLIRPPFNQPDRSLVHLLKFDLNFKELPIGRDNLVVAQLDGTFSKINAKTGAALHRAWRVHLPEPIVGGKNNSLVIEWANWTDITKAEWNGTVFKCVNIAANATLCSNQ